MHGFLINPAPPPPCRASNTRRAVTGSVTAPPAALTTQPSGISRPFSSYTLTLFAATVLVAMSRRNGGLCPAGAAKAMGLVPSTGSAPKVGTTRTPRAELATRPTTPRSAARRA
jgi:hypothetical protein